MMLLLFVCLFVCLFVYDAVITIYSISTQPTSSKMGIVIHQYGLTLITIWEKAFGKKHVMSLSGVQLKLKKIIKKYYNQVYNKAHRKMKKKRKANEIKTQEESRESIRSLNKQWRLSNNNNNLFDIGKEMEKLVGREKEFYIDQLTTRECRISEEIDKEYVREQQIIYEDIAEQQEYTKLR